MFTEQPETIRYAVNQPFGGHEICPLCPIQKNLFEVAVRFLADTITHYWLEVVRPSSLRPLAFTPSGSFFSPSRPSYSVNLPASIDSIPARTRRRMLSSCCPVRSQIISSALGSARRTVLASSSSIRRSASRTTSLALLYWPVFTFFRTNPARRSVIEIFI